MGIPRLEEVALHAEGPLALLAWHVPAASGRPTVAYLHGNGGNLAHRADRIRAFAQAGLGVMMVEYPRYGGNPGRPSEAGMMGAARAALARLGAIGVPARSVVLYGESIGTAVATRMAVERPVAGLVLESPYTSVLDLARLRFWFLPVRLLLRDRFEQLSVIPKVRAPLLVLQGSRDAIVPPGMGHAVFEAAGGPKALWAAPDGGHNDLAAHGALERAIAFALSLCAGSALQDGGGRDRAEAGSRATASPAQPRQGAGGGASHRGIMAGVRRGVHKAVAIGFAVLAIELTQGTAGKGHDMDGHQVETRSPLRDAIIAALRERRRGGTNGLGPATGPGVDISALFTTYVAKGMMVMEATEALRSANLVVRPVLATGEGGPRLLRASAELEATAYTTTDVVVFVTLEPDADGTERVAQVKAALMWSAL